MEANQNEAISLCKSILDNGSRNADVYWKLASALFQDGQQVSAERTLDDALRLHPGNSKLLKLQDFISSATTEQGLLSGSASYGDATPLKDSPLLNDLSRLSSPTQLNEPVSISDQRPNNTDINSAPVIKSDNELTLTDTDPIATNDIALQLAEERKNAYNKLVTQVQSTLNELGFPIGTPDGFPGSKTRNALSDFYTVLDKPASKSITELTLVDLNSQKSKLADAKQLIKQSKDALARNNIALAKIKLADAKSSSQLLKVPEELERKLRDFQSNDLANNSDNTSAATAAATLARSEPKFGGPESPDAQETTTSISAELDNAPAETFDELMNRINTLHGKIRRVEEDQIRRLDQVRDLM